MSEKKAYDLEELGKELKAVGLKAAEDNLELLYKTVSSWFQKSAKASVTPVDDIVALVIKQLDASILKGLDKIDPNS